ncbi:MAG TPA: fatty acid desaturase [Sphingomonas sp.]
MRSASRQRRRSRRNERRSVEWPTVWLAGAIYAGWLALTWWHAMLPMPLIALAGAWLVAWQSSLQHETIHGHPTRWRWVNDAIGFAPLSLYLPYALYRRSHLAHHASEWITHPRHDPESRYLKAEGTAWRWLAKLQATLAGRLLIGPLVAVLELAHDEARRLRTSPREVAGDWLPHLAAAGLLIVWLEWTGFGLGRYLLFIVYPGVALTLLRSFVEHRADLPGRARAATVERGGLLGLLFLNNHFHAAHHERPDLAWYRLPAYQRHHAKRLTAAPAQAYRSYGEILRRFAFRLHDTLTHPHQEAIG